MNNSRYALPAVAALTLHTFFFFGFTNPGTHPTPVDREPARVLPPLPPQIIEVTPLEEPEQPVEKREARTAVDLPRGPDAPQLPNPGDFVIPVEQVPVVVAPGKSRIDPMDNTGIIGKQAIGEAMDEIVNSVSLDNPPKATLQGAPNYPYALKQQGITGVVEVEFVVDRRGRVHQARVLRAATSEFIEPTLRAVECWRFEPGTKCGSPVSFRMRVPVVFSLDK